MIIIQFKNGINLQKKERIVVFIFIHPPEQGNKLKNNLKEIINKIII